LFLNTAGDITLLPFILEAAANRIPKPDVSTMNEMVTRLNISKIFPFPMN